MKNEKSQTAVCSHFPGCRFVKSKNNWKILLDTAGNQPIFTTAQTAPAAVATTTTTTTTSQQIVPNQLLCDGCWELQLSREIAVRWHIEKWSSPLIAVMHATRTMQMESFACLALPCLDTRKTVKLFGKRDNCGCDTWCFRFRQIPFEGKAPEYSLHQIALRSWDVGRKRVFYFDTSLWFDNIATADNPF